MSFEFAVPDMLADPDAYALFWADSLTGITVEDAKQAVTIRKKIIELEKELNKKHEQLAMLIHNNTHSKPRYVQVLYQLGQQDKLLIGAAKELNISINTANQHIAKARRSFACKTTTGAVYRAVKEGII